MTPPAPTSSPASPPLPALSGDGPAFRCSIPRLLLLPLVWGSPLVTVLWLAARQYFQYGKVFYVILASGLVFAAFWNVILLSITAFVMRVRVGVDGIKGHTFWGTPTMMRWDELAGVQPRSMLGIPYLRLAPAQRRQTLWLPWLLTDPRAFAEAVRQYGGPDSPLTRWLEERGHLSAATSPERKNLNALLAGITPDNIHKEQNFGGPQGREEL